MVTKDKTRVQVTLPRDMLAFIDDVCRKANADDPPERERLTRSRFIELCVLHFAVTQKNEAKEN